MSVDRVCVLSAGAGASWEPHAVGVLEQQRSVVLLRRCLDLTDLLATAALGQAQVAILDARTPGLDADAVAHLLRGRVLPLVVVPAAATVSTQAPLGDWLWRIGVRAVIADDNIAQLPDAVRALGSASVSLTSGTSGPGSSPVGQQQPSRGQVIAVWGPNGAPGRTTLAIGVASALAARGRSALLVDVDPWGGAAAQHLGVLDEVSGLLACVRAAGAGQRAAQFPVLQRKVSGFRLVSGLPRADRWMEVRDGVIEEMIDLGAATGDVVLDTGFSLAEETTTLPGRADRNQLTRAALAAADEVLVTCLPDPVGLARAARGLTDLADHLGGRPVHVVVNRWRPRLGLNESDVSGLLSGHADIAGLHFLPEDGAWLDRALAIGRAPAEVGAGPWVKAVDAMLEVVAPATTLVAGRGSRVRGLRGRRGEPARLR